MTWSATGPGATSPSTAETTGDLTFVRWNLHATGAHGPFKLTGIDRVRLRGPLVSENVIVFDTAAFQARAGIPVPWATA